MKTKKLISKIKAFFDPELHQQQLQQSSLKKVLDKLKKRERELANELEREKKSDRREALKKKIAVIRSQRKKGLKLLKSLQAAGKGAAPGD